MTAVWLVDQDEGIPPLVMRLDSDRGLSQITSDGLIWRNSERPHREVMRGGYAERVTEAEARAVFGRLPDDPVPAAS